MHPNMIMRTFSSPVARRIPRLRSLLAQALTICFVATAANAHAGSTSLAPALTIASAQRLESTAAEGAFQPVKFLPQHNSRPAPPPNRTSFTKPPPHHA
jgi:hypothetical protein